jgi:hypothetical protein
VQSGISLMPTIVTEKVRRTGSGAVFFTTQSAVQGRVEIESEMDGSKTANERRGNWNCPTQAKSGLEWATLFHGLSAYASPADRNPGDIPVAVSLAILVHCLVIP